MAKYMTSSLDCKIYIMTKKKGLKASDTTQFLCKWEGE